MSTSPHTHTTHKREIVSCLVELAVLLVILQGAATLASESAPVPLWRNGRPACRIVLPSGDQRANHLARSTLAYYLRRFYGLELPVARGIDQPGTYIVVGTPANNPSFAKLVASGLALTTKDTGEEGFQLLTHTKGKSRYVIVYGKTPRALKHGLQELIFYRMPAGVDEGSIEWPLDVVMTPEFLYRGSYICTCWSPQDSMESWERLLRFNSETTLNRIWFYLDGFPVAGHMGIYPGTPLADAKNVQSLIDLVNDEDMKFYVGGGWLNWHQRIPLGEDNEKAVAWYLDYLKAFRNIQGFYIEGTGEARESQNWRAESDGLRRLIETVLRQRPDFEISLAIGMFNNSEYLKRMAQVDPKRVYWWWCWGDPIRDKALDLFPNVLRWHRPFGGPGEAPIAHGHRKPPEPSERALTGMATTYDAFSGWGNPWTGYRSETDEEEYTSYPPDRNFDPYTIPYFFVSYYFRERCWNLGLTEGELAARLQRRLFDADAPPDGGQHYVELSRKVSQAFDGKKHPLEDLMPMRAWLNPLRRRVWTPRTMDTLARMDEALAHLFRIARGQEITP